LFCDETGAVAAPLPLVSRPSTRDRGHVDARSRPMLLLALAAAAAQEPSNESPRVHLASFAFGKPYTDTLEWYREHARSLGFAGALLWGREELESDPLFASSLTHLVDLQKGTRPYCAGFKSLMLHRSLERSREGDYVMWADASRHFDYTNRNLTGLDVNAAVTRLRRDCRTNVYGFVMCKGVGPTKRKKSLPHCCKRDDVVDGNCRDKPRPVDSTLSRVAELSPALLAFFPPNVSAHLEKPEINTAHLLLQNNRETRGLVKEFLRYPPRPRRNLPSHAASADSSLPARILRVAAAAASRVVLSSDASALLSSDASALARPAAVDDPARSRGRVYPSRHYPSTSPLEHALVCSSSPRTIHAAPAAAPRPVSAEYPRRRPRRRRDSSKEYPRRGHGAAATRLRGRPPRNDASTPQVQRRGLRRRGARRRGGGAAALRGVPGAGR